MKIGFIGMGIMGVPMSKNVLKAGNEVMVYNRTPERIAPVAEAGAKAVQTPKLVAQGADAVILMLTGPEAVDSVLFGEKGVLSGIKPGTPIINMSTVSPAYSRQLNERIAEASAVLIDAPVSGSKKPAEDGTLIILAGGPKEKVRELEPLLLTMGKKVVYCGEAGQGSSMKMAVNLLLGIMMEGFCEAVNFGQRCGLATETLLDAFLAGPLSCGLFNLKAEMFKNDDFPPQFPLKHITKDLRFVLQTADENGAAIPIGSSLFQLFRLASGQHWGDMDFAVVKKILEAMSDR